MGTKKRRRGSKPGSRGRSTRWVNLNRLYMFYNRRFFGGRLPRRMSIVLFSGAQRPRGELGTYLGPGARVRLLNRRRRQVCRYEGPLIMVRADMPIMIVRHTLLHEMAHASGVYNHGPRFDREMLRLARAGAFNGIW